jgi:hypothetical protein
MEILRRRVGLVLVAVGLVTAATAEADSRSPFATLLVKAETDLVLIVDGETVGELEGGEIRRVDVGRGQHLIQAKRPGTDRASWEKVLNTAEPQQYVLRIRLPDKAAEPPAAEPEPQQREARHREAPSAEPLPEDPGEGMVYDRKTDLIWTASDNGGMIDWSEAERYCEDLSLGGWQDWRLPTFSELGAMYDESVEGDWKIRQGIELSECCIWSSQQPYSYSSTTFNFYSGRSHTRDRDEAELQRALCVRGGAPAQGGGAD